ncbi:MAG: PAS domain-containing protein, partial [Betaproteobacteria bacterium]
MPRPRALTRLDGSSVLTVGETLDFDALTALSQRKLNALGLPIAYVDREQRYRFANKAFADWLGKRVDEIVGHEVIEVLGRELYQLYHAYVEAALSGERTGYERQLASAARPSIWIRVDYFPDRSLNGSVRGFLITYSDVDQLKRLELEAGQREHRLRLVTDSVGLPILYFDRQQKLRFGNKPLADWIGVPADDLIGHALRDFLPADALAEMQGYIDRALVGATVSYERRERKPDGEMRWVRITLFPDREMGGRVGGVFAVMNDIEDDVRVRDALKSQQSQLKLFADNIPGPIAYLDKALRYTFVNQAFANWACRPQHEILGTTPSDVLPQDVAGFLRPILKRAQAGENVEYE